MTDASQLAKLKDRIEKAEGPSPAIDADIAEALDLYKGHFYASADCGDGGWLCFEDGKMFWDYHSYPNGIKFDDAESALRAGAAITATRTAHPPKAGTLHAMFEAEYPKVAAKYTASVDAALSLVERFVGKERPIKDSSPSDLLHKALNTVGKKHALHIRFWDDEKDGDFKSALALALLAALLSALLAMEERDGE